MRALAICQDELVIRSLEDVLAPSFELEFLVESRPLARRLHEAGLQITPGDPRRIDTYLKADLSPSTCVIVEDNGSRGPAENPGRDSGRGRDAHLCIAHGAKSEPEAAEDSADEFPDVTDIELAELIGRRWSPSSAAR